MKAPVVVLLFAPDRGVRGGAIIGRGGAGLTMRLRLTAGRTVTGGGNSSAAPSVESENDRVGCGAMLTRRSGSRAIGSPPPRGPSASNASIISIGTQNRQHKYELYTRRLSAFARVAFVNDDSATHAN